MPDAALVGPSPYLPGLAAAATPRRPAPFREQVGGAGGDNRDVHRNLCAVCGDGVAERAFEQVDGDLAGNMDAEQLDRDEVVGS